MVLRQHLWLGVRRYSSLKAFSTDQLPQIIGAIDPNSIFVISLPVTTRRSYIYCNHRPSILDQKQAKKFPLITKVETKLTGLAKKGWTKLTTSKNSINIRIVRYVTKLLYTIPYEESCLRSFPSKNSMIREVNEEALADDKVPTQSGALVQQEIDNLQIGTEQLKRIPLFHPSFQKPHVVLDQLQLLRDVNRPHHLKYSIACVVGIPLTLPFALVPIVPNVPGFYVAYRAYCHLKALWGTKNLGYLLESDSSTGPATQHLEFNALNGLSDLYEHQVDIDLDSVQKEEEMVITEPAIDALCARFHLDHLKEDLKKAMDQESRRLSKQLQEEQLVE